jgi:preprotein translocase subunit SecD
MNFKQLFTQWQVVLFFVALLGSLILIAPQFSSDGVAIKAVIDGSPAQLAQMITPAKTVKPVDLEYITAIDGQTISSVSQYYEYLQTVLPNATITVETNKGVYSIDLNDSQSGLRVVDRASSNIRFGLDLVGGTRILLKPQLNISTQDFADIKANIEQRLNLFGLSDLRVTVVTDINGKPQFILVEIAGVSVDEITSLISRQGKFEAKIGNTTVFSGDEVRVMTGGNQQLSGVTSCGAGGEQGYICQFQFPIKLLKDAPKRQAQATANLTVISEGTQRYLSQKLDLYLDGQLMDSLSIAADLKGKTLSDISISGSASGASVKDARSNTLANMKELQTVLKTGNLPSKLDIVRADTISATLGSSFISNALLVGLVSMIAVFIIVLFRYKSLVLAIPMSFISFSEVVILLGFAAFIGWNLDLAAIASIIVMLGSGINHQIIITDEILQGEKRQERWLERMKKAFGVIFVAYMTTCVAMLPLLFTGAGLLKGFALVTIVGMSIGVLIARPAYSIIAQQLLEK